MADSLSKLLDRTRQLVHEMAERRPVELAWVRELRWAAMRAKARLRPLPAPVYASGPKRAALLGFTSQGPLFVFAVLLERPTPVPILSPHLVVTEAEAAQAPLVPIIQPTSCPTGGFCSPFWIESFPFEHHGSTRVSSERHFSTYECAPTIDEGGAEIWFEFELEARSRLVAEIVEVPEDGVDIDLHLLTSEDEPKCLQRADGKIETTLDPGVYLLVLDTCSELGFEQPGPYHLKVDRQPQ